MTFTRFCLLFSAILILACGFCAASPACAQEAAAPEVATTVAAVAEATVDDMAWRAPYDVRSGGICFFLLLMAGAGVAALFLKQIIPAILFIAGVLLLGVDPLVDLIAFRLMTGSSTTEDAGWIYSLASLLTSIVAYGLITSAFLIAATRARAAAR